MASASVLVLEAGPSDWHPFIHIPAGFIKTFHDPRVNWLYSMEPSEWTGGRRILAPRGKTLGGSSAINGHIYNRGQRMDFDTWAQMGNRGWGYADVLPYFRRMERRLGDGDPTYRGRDGALDGLRSRLAPPAVRGVHRRRREPRHPAQPRLQRRRAGGRRLRPAHHPQRPQGKRRHRLPAPGAQAAERDGAHPRAHHGAAAARASAASASPMLSAAAAGLPARVRAAREVILSAGSYNSPQLLQLSGIGPAPLLQSLGIPVRHALAGVGEGLRDHYAPRFTARVKNIDTINERARGLRLAREVVRYMTMRKGILALNPTLIYCFWRSDPSVAISDLQFTFTPASYREGVQGELDLKPGMTIASWQQRPESRGWVRLRSTDPFEAPIIQPNYLAEESDRRVLLAGMKLARRLLKTEPLKPYYDYEDFPGEKVQSDDELLGAAKQRGTTTFHPAGTCRMGPRGDPLAVVDDELRVHGLEGLRVIDASIMPTMLSANLNAATLMLADKASDLIRGRTPPEPVALTRLSRAAGG